ncbi:bifunctional hydroxymethylpyrimidine kinase/phosphomethylpyrimidine kinase [Streptosporangiaceae bacterium NEAU-GS5]|nr:bifunctional hydroxymethylpyrimidine kinase/phosphomethylpyrimidine kinase [Streptosporangiaceae bacterium NEAU-GS5]
MGRSVGVDVVVVGEPLVEFSADRALGEAEVFRLSFSGDALNASVAAAAAGAHVALVTRVGRDEFGERLIAFAAAHGVHTAWMRPGDGSTGAYAVGADPTGSRAFAYLRAASAATRMTADDVDDSPVAEARVVLLSGVGAAVAEPTVLRAAEVASGRVVYDPNYRGRLTTPEAARRVLERVAPHAALVTPSCPGDSGPLFGTDDPDETAGKALALGARAVAVTRGPEGVLLRYGGGAGAGTPSLEHVPAFPAGRIVDQTGAGDAFAGALSAWLARGADLAEAVRAGAAAAAVSLEGQGGTGRVAARAEIEALLQMAMPGAETF